MHAAEQAERRVGVLAAALAQRAVRLFDENRFEGRGQPGVIHAGREQRSCQRSHRAQYLGSKASPFGQLPGWCARFRQAAGWANHRSRTGEGREEV